MSDLMKIVDQLSSLTLLQSAELSKMLEEKWGVSASAPAAVAVSAEPVAAVVQKTSFDVILSSAGDKKIEVIKTVREITGLGLKEAKDVVDGAPKAVKLAVGQSEADEIKAKLEAAGAKVEIK